MAVMRMPRLVGMPAPGRTRDMSPPGGGPPASEAQGITAAAPAPADTDLAAATRVAIGAIVAIAAGWAVVLALHQGSWPAALKVNGDMASFALFYVAAQAIERLIEPFSQLFLTTSDTKKELDSNVARALAT